jgi:hypothetical protein
VWNALYIDGSMARVLEWSQVPFDRYRPAARLPELMRRVHPSADLAQKQDELFAYLQIDRFQVRSVYAVLPLCWEDLPQESWTVLWASGTWRAGRRDASNHSHPLAASLCS